MNSSLRIGVVGGGASAVCLLAALARAGDLSNGRLVVYEPSARPWRGRPYQPDMDTVRVNAPPQDMSVCADQPGHFQDWLLSNDLLASSGGPYWDGRAGTAFVPRTYYGAYLEQSAWTAWTTLLRRGWRVELVRDRVERVIPGQDDLTLVTAGGSRTRVDHVVLGVGGGAPADLYSLSDSDRFVADPYPLVRTVSGIDPDATVGVIGSGLTAVDVVRSLTSAGHRGRISLLSRRGVLPSVRQRPIHHQPRYFTPTRLRALAAGGANVTLAQLGSIMTEELRAAGENPAALWAELAAVEHEAPTDRLRRQLAAVGSPRMSLRILQQLVPEAGPDVWPLLSDAEQDHLLARHHRTVMSICCPMSPANAEFLLRTVHCGQLRVVRGLRAVCADRGGRFTIHTGQHRETADVVINAVNPRLRGFSAQARPLVESLVAAGLAERHPRGGLRVQRATSALTTGGQARRGIYALGDTASGSLFFTFGIQSLVDRAADVVGAIRSEHIASATNTRAAHGSFTDLMPRIA
ncbi:hypothetical protein ALI144C_36670 [Actinosynnema sp. ALI-1.44]|uniref:FAD/NAD(P)-binding protein n=1 Tax=Actinosynnema sp. ALI-1.44 TaxID=1933779 RepID=UPI00097BA912|nr:FAD/NAD(P)-binding protein [Actinosynnema sp. ALI-1.44]ONI76210.1 hypothetical protein ALI144C_36670 [Actinosynnema sp. ALI-1.44]